MKVDNCQICVHERICVVRVLLFCGDVDDTMKKVAKSPDHYANMRGIMRQAVAENCEYYTKSLKG